MTWHAWVWSDTIRIHCAFDFWMDFKSLCIQTVLIVLNFHNLHVSPMNYDPRFKTQHSYAINSWRISWLKVPGYPFSIVNITGHLKSWIRLIFFSNLHSKWMYQCLSPQIYHLDNLPILATAVAFFQLFTQKSHGCL